MILITCLAVLLPPKSSSSRSSPLLAPKPSVRIWSSQSGSIVSTRHIDQSLTAISSSTLNLSAPSMELPSDSSVLGAPGLYFDYVVFGGNNGSLNAYNRTSKTLVWSRRLNTYYATSRVLFTRTTPAFYGSSFFIGVMNPADVLKIDLATGDLLGRVNLDAHPSAQVLQSGVVHKNRFYVGVSSNEETTASSNASYACCTFVGSFHAIDADALTILWTWRPMAQTVGTPGALSGNAIWGPSPSIDEASGTVFIGTGNNYGVNAVLDACTAANAASLWEANCFAALYPDNWFNAVVAIDIATGNKVWARRFSNYESWKFACEVEDVSALPNCPAYATLGGADFGMAPSLSQLGAGKALYIAQKLGVVYCLNATSGDVIWARYTSPVGVLGGHSWGIAVDDSSVYAGVLNNNNQPWILLNGSTVSGGGWVALNKTSGAVQWTTSNPAAYDVAPNNRALTAWGAGPPLSVGDLLLVGSTDSVRVAGQLTYGSGGYVYALDKTSGAILGSYETKSGVYGGFSGDSSCVFVGSGGTKFLNITAGKAVFGWCV